MADEKIKNSRELEFAVFCIENVAAKLGVDAERVYQAFTEKSNILNGCCQYWLWNGHKMLSYAGKI